MGQLATKYVTLVARTFGQQGVELTETLAFVDVRATPPTGEGGGVVGRERRHRTSRHVVQFLWSNRELRDVGSSQSVAAHGLAQVGFDGAQVLTDDVDPESLRLDRDDGQEFLEGHRHVDAFVRRRSLGDPEESLQSHDVVDAHDTRDAHVEAQRLTEHRVRVVATVLGVRWWRPPGLALNRELVRRCADRHRRHVLFGVAPHVVAEGMHPDGDVQFQGLTALGEPRRQVGHLDVDDPLGQHVVAHDRRIDVVPAQQSALGRRRPAVKVESEAFTGGAEPGVVVHVGVIHQERLQSALVAGDELALGRRPRLDDVALRRERRRPVDDAVDDPRGPTLGCVGLVHEVLGRR